MLEEWVKIQKLVIGFIYRSGKPVDLMKARSYVQNTHFIGKYGEFWRLFIWYYDKHSSVLSLPILRDLARSKGWTEQMLMEYEQVLAECEEVSATISDGDFAYYLERMVDIYKQIKFAEAMEKGAETLQSKGFVDARNLVLEKLSRLEQSGINYKSEMDMQKGIDSFVNTVGSARLRRAESVDFNISQLDNIVLGLRRGDFCLIAAFAGVGKTSLCVNTAVEVAYVQTKNVVYITTETVIDGLLRRIVSRISKLPLFEIPISSEKFKSGELTPVETEELLKIKEYIKKGNHGHLMVTQAPPGANLAWLRGRLLQYESSFPVDLVILDDLRNMKPQWRRKAEWEEFNDILKDAKAIARTHAGRGVPLISPYQISREGEKNKRQNDTKRYRLMDLSSSSEAERTPDVIIALLSEEDDPQNIRIQVMKQRDGKTGRDFGIKAEFEFQFFYETSEGDSGFL